MILKNKLTRETLEISYPEFRKKFAKEIHGLTIALTTPRTKSSKPMNKFQTNATAVVNAPTITPVALIDEPVTLFIAAIIAYIAAMTAIIISKIHVKGHARSAALKPCCAAVAANVAPVDIIIDAA